MSDFKNYYEILRIPRTSDSKQIKARAQSMLDVYRPAAAEGDEAAQARVEEITEAYAVLSNKRKREEYDAAYDERFGSQSARPGRAPRAKAPKAEDQDLSKELHWYAIHTYSGHENKVATNIVRRAESLGLKGRIAQTFIPMEKEMRVIAGKTREMPRKMFPGYVFIEMMLDDVTWHLVKNTTGVTGFLSSGDKPIPLKEEEVKQLSDIKEGKQPTRVEFEVGDIVRVTSGPFAEFTGKIDEVNLEKQKMRVLIELFGRDTPVELAFNEVDKEISESRPQKK